MRAQAAASAVGTQGSTLPPTHAPPANIATRSLTSNVSALTDGQLETSIQFEAKDLDFTIDLGKVKLVKSLSTTFKEVTFKRFFLPETASFMVSADGVNYETVATYASPTLPENRKIFNSKGEMSGKVGKPIRYVRLLAKNPGLVQGKSTITGQLTKVLLDEIVVD